MRVLVTGSTGNLGRKAVAALGALTDDRGDDGGVEVVEVASDADPSRGGVRADLSTYDDGWADAFRDVDAVLHLAADRRPEAPWDSLQRLNLDLPMHVLRAAEEHGVGRFVFASSNWVLGGYRFTDVRLTPGTPPRPVNPYGVSKLVLERVGMATSARTGMSFLALRIGYCQPGENRPGPHMLFGRWGQEMWLSNEDWAQAVQRSCTAPFSGAAVVNVMSENAGMRWDLADTERLIGYRPQSHHTPRLTVAGRVRDVGVRARDALAPRMPPAPPVGRDW
jgi:nucleoside-diphosphate-sugar epimerase